MSDTLALRLREVANTQLRDRWLELKRLTGAATDEGVGKFFGENRTQQDFGNFLDDLGYLDELTGNDARAKATSWRSDALYWIGKAHTVLQSGGLSEGELDRLGGTFDIINGRQIILSDAGIGRHSPTATFLNALPEEIKKQIPVVAAGLGIVVVAIIALLILTRR